MTRRVLTVAALTLLWVVLWGSFSIANLLSGIAIAGLSMLMSPPRTEALSIGFRPIKAIRLVVFFGWELMRASLQVAWEVVTPPDNTAPAVVHVQLHTSSPAIMTTVAGMVSLTPGTLTLEVYDDTRSLFIHVLHFESKNAVVTQVHKLESLVLDAFPSR